MAHSEHGPKIEVQTVCQAGTTPSTEYTTQDAARRICTRKSLCVGREPETCDAELMFVFNPDDLDSDEAQLRLESLERENLANLGRLS